MGETKLSGEVKPITMGADGIAVGHDGTRLYDCPLVLHRQARYSGGKDLRQKPYVLLRTPIDAGPVRLAR